MWETGGTTPLRTPACRTGNLKGYGFRALPGISEVNPMLSWMDSNKSQFPKQKVGRLSFKVFINRALRDGQPVSCEDG